jgi:hypothetical protein
MPVLITSTGLQEASEFLLTHIPFSTFGLFGEFDGGLPIEIALFLRQVQRVSQDRQLIADSVRAHLADAGRFILRNAFLREVTEWQRESKVGEEAMTENPRAVSASREISGR